MDRSNNGTAHARHIPDLEARILWKKVAAASDSVGDLISEVPYSSASGAQTRMELSSALALLEQAIALLKLTQKREAGKYAEVAHG